MVENNNKYHRHEWTENEDKLICYICGKEVLNLKQTDNIGILEGTRKNGSKYSVRQDRRRYFFPQEWDKFIAEVKDKDHKFFFLMCLHTGGRIMEVLNIRHCDINIERCTIKFNTVKQRKAKKNFYATGTSRDFFLASNFIRAYKAFIRGKTIDPNSYIFLDNSKLPKNYISLDNSEKKKYYISKSVAYFNMMKRKVKKCGIEDWQNFSPHNIRKTYGMWMRTFNLDFGELCYRMGHDMDTYLAHYGSSLIFTEAERRHIQRILGDVK